MRFAASHTSPFGPITQIGLSYGETTKASFNRAVNATHLLTMSFNR